MGKLVAPAEVLRRRREAAEAIVGEAMNNLSRANGEVKAAFEHLCAAQRELNEAVAECVAFDARQRLRQQRDRQAPRLRRMAAQQRALKDARRAMAHDAREQEFRAVEPASSSRGCTEGAAQADILLPSADQLAEA